MPAITYYFSTLSPYCYLAGTRLEQIAAKHTLEIDYKPLDISTLFSRTGGQAPKERHPSRQEYRVQELPRQAQKARLPFNLYPAHWPTNGAPAAYAFIAAQSSGGAGDLAQLAHLILRACWAEEKDIAQDDVIRDCLVQAGFDPDVADRGMLIAADTYTRNLDEAVGNGVFGAPFYIAPSGQKFWGQDRLADLDAHLSGQL